MDVLVAEENCPNPNLDGIDPKAIHTEFQALSERFPEDGISHRQILS
ncbi:hypothetical protein [Prevotella sp. oral taxon 376]|nr:hypothetical protein [Prevotella sp. oral taxon 376]